MSKGTSHLVVRRAATGLGLFTLKNIPAGRRIIEYVGPVVTAEEGERRRGKYFFEIDENYAIDGSPRANTARYINHCCRPNAEAFVTGKRIWVWSKRAIRAGEEITLNYGKAYFDDYIKPMGCKCAVCRRRASRRRRPGAASAESD